MNRKAFTLIELIVITVILGVIVAFTLPNITSSMEKQKKNEVILVAKDMVEKTKKILLANKAFYPKTGEAKAFSLNFIDKKNEINNSSYGYPYNKSQSFVVVYNNNNNYEYYVNLIACSCKIDEWYRKREGYNKDTKIVVGNYSQKMSEITYEELNLVSVSSNFYESLIGYDLNKDGYIETTETETKLNRYLCDVSENGKMIKLQKIEGVNVDKVIEYNSTEFPTGTSESVILNKKMRDLSSNYKSNHTQTRTILGFYY